MVTVAVLRWSYDVGGCMFCTRHITHDGEWPSPHRVVLVEGKGSIVRFCRACAGEIGLRWPKG